MHPRYVEAWERRLTISVCGLGLWGYLPFSLWWICASFQDLFCLLNVNTVFFFSKKKKVSGLPSLSPPPSSLFILSFHVGAAPRGHVLLQSFFAAWLFSEQIWNRCSYGFLTINFAMVLKEIRMHCCIKLFLIKENHGKKIGNTSKLYVDKF